MEGMAEPPAEYRRGEDRYPRGEREHRGRVLECRRKDVRGDRARVRGSGSRSSPAWRPERIMKYAFDEARKREKKHVTSVTKSNGICITMPYWDEMFWEIAKEYPDMRTDQYHVDSLCATLVAHPEKFDVIVASNLFGDIVSDLCPALAGSLGIAPSASLNPERTFPSTFEPVHGSAPDIYGKKIANPIAPDPHRGHDDRSPGVPGSGPKDRKGRGGRSGGQKCKNPGSGRRGIDTADGESHRRTGGDIVSVTDCGFFTGAGRFDAHGGGFLRGHFYGKRSMLSSSQCEFVEDARSLRLRFRAASLLSPLLRERKILPVSYRSRGPGDRG